MGPEIIFFVSRLRELHFRSSKAYRTWIWSLWTSIFIFWPSVTIQYQCDTSRGIIWYHDFWPTAPLRRQYLKLCTLTFLGSWSSFQCTTDLHILFIGKYIQFKNSHDNPVSALHLTWRNMMPWYWVYGTVTVPNARLFVFRLSEIFDYYSKAIMI